MPPFPCLQTPVNYALLLLFTLCEGYLVGTVASYYEVKSVVLAVAMTAAITLGLTIFAFQVLHPPLAFDVLGVRSGCGRGRGQLLHHVSKCGMCPSLCIVRALSAEEEDGRGARVGVEGGV